MNPPTHTDRLTAGYYSASSNHRLADRVLAGQDFQGADHAVGSGARSRKTPRSSSHRYLENTLCWTQYWRRTNSSHPSWASRPAGAEHRQALQCPARPPAFQPFIGRAWVAFRSRMLIGHRRRAPRTGRAFSRLIRAYDAVVCAGPAAPRRRRVYSRPLHRRC